MIAVLIIIKAIEFFYLVGNTYSIIVFYALLSHNVFDMVTRQGVAFWYPFSTRPCVLPANPEMRLRTNDIRSEAVVFMVFCSLILFCQPLFANGFWQSYNKTFMTYSHIERETKRKDDYLNITFVSPQLDTLSGLFVGEQGADFVIFGADGFTFHPKSDCKYLDFKHSGKIRKLETLQVLGVSADSMKVHLSQPMVKMQLQSNIDLEYFEGVTRKVAKSIEKEYIQNFDFYIEQQDNTRDLLEIETLELRIAEQQNNYNREVRLVQNEIGDLESEYSTGEFKYPQKSNYEKGLWVARRRDIQNQLTRLNRDKSRILPPTLEADYLRLNNLKSNITEQKVLLSGSFVRL